MSLYPKMVNGDRVFLRRGKEYFKMACCDCGLTHVMGIELNRDKHFVVRFWRDNRSTAQLRRHGFGNLHKKGSWEIVRRRV